MTKFDIFTLFPEIIEAYTGVSILKRAQEKGVVKINTHQIRDFTTDKHHTTDDTPYGGGAGMVMKAEPILRGVSKIIKNKKSLKSKRKIVILSAKGKQFTQKLAYDWSKKYNHIILISGRYEGIDERVKTILKAEEISIGPYVTTDGDVGAMIIISAVARLIPSAIRKESLDEESHGDAKSYKLKTTSSIEYPHYTRPEAFIWAGKSYRVPKVLLSGDHKKVENWRLIKRKRRP